MTRILRLSLLSLALVGVALFAKPQPAECRACGPTVCHGFCSVGCVCMRQGTNPAGRCVSFDVAPQLEAAGWDRWE